MKKQNPFSILEGNSSQKFKPALVAFFVLGMSNSWRTRKLLIEQYPALLSDELMFLLENMISELSVMGGGGDFYEIFELLKNCAHNGVEETFKSYEQTSYNETQALFELLYPEASEGGKEYIPRDLDPFVKLASNFIQVYEQFALLDFLDLRVVALDSSISGWQEVLNHETFQKVGVHAQVQIYDQYSGALLARYKKNRQLEDLENAIPLLEILLTYIPEDDPNYPVLLDRLSVCLRDHFSVERNEQEKIKKSISLSRMAVRKTSLNSSNYYVYLSNLGSSLGEYYQATKKITVLEESINIFNSCIYHSTPGGNNYVIYMKNFFNAAKLFFLFTHNTKYLDEFVKIFNTKLEFEQIGFADYYNLSSNLADALVQTYDTVGQLSQIDFALNLSQELLKNSPEDFGKCDVLNTIGQCYIEKYYLSGSIEYLNKAVTTNEKAIQEAHKQNNNESLNYLTTNLGNALLAFYKHTNELEFLNGGINAYQRALKLTPSDDVRLPHYLSNLSNGLSNLYYANGDLSILEECKDLLKKAIKLTNPDDDPVGYPRFANNLSSVFSDFYDSSKEVRYLDLATEYAQIAIDNTLESSPELVVRLNNLSQCLLRRYYVQKEANFLEKSIETSRHALEKSKPNTIEFYDTLHKLGRQLDERYQLVAENKDLQESNKYFREVCKNIKNKKPLLVYDASQYWGVRAFEQHSWAEAVEAFEYNFEAYEALFQLQITDASKQKLLRNFQPHQYLAYSLAQCGNIHRAIEVLEQGQARLLSDKLQETRRDLENLNNIGHEELYQKYKAATDKIRNLTKTFKNKKDVSQTRKHSYSTLEEDRKKLQEAIHDIQKIPGYKNFLHLVTWSEIVEIANTSPLVYLLNTVAGSLALIIERDKVEEIWLDDFDAHSMFTTMLGVDYKSWQDTISAIKLKDENLIESDSLQKLKMGYFIYILSGADLQAHDLTYKNWRNALKKTNCVIGKGVMDPIVRSLVNQSCESATIIPTGILGFFPLHSAEISDPFNREKKSFVLDHINLKFAPSARALQNAQSVAMQTNAENLLVIDNPDTSLKYSKEEALAYANFDNKLNLSGDDANFKNVMKELPNYTTLHFSTHGKANLESPLENSILLSDGSITLKDIMGLPLYKTRLVLLAACETGLFGTDAPNEMISFPTGLIQAGAAGVISTLWSVSDISTAMLMIRFYDTWKNEYLDPSNALRQAQIWLRDTTNLEKQSYFQEIMPQAFSKYFELQNPNTRSFSDPFFWAGFTYTGA